MPNQDRSIRNVQVNHKHVRSEHQEHKEPGHKPRRRGWRIWWLILAVVVAAAVLGLFVSTVFTGASLTVTPRTAIVTLPSTMLAQVDAPVGTLSYQTLSVTQSATTTVPAKGTEHVEKQASGTIVISNTFSTASQRLIANTRFQAPDGKIYRIRDSVVVPGMKGTAGTVSVTVYADSPGPDYNRSGTTAYTIPGFKGDPRYAKITASSGPMTGGFVGDQPSIAQSDLQAAQTQIEQQLNTSVMVALTKNLPDGYEIVKGAVKVTYSPVTQTPMGNDSAALSQTATGVAATVRINDLANAIAKQTVTGYQGEAVTFDDPAAVTMSATSTKQSNTLTLTFDGQAKLVWVFDANAVKAALVGKQKSDFETIIRSFEPAIASADASIRPFWTSTFPTEPDKISISVKKEQ